MWTTRVYGFRVLESGRAVEVGHAPAVTCRALNFLEEKGVVRSAKIAAAVRMGNPRVSGIIVGQIVLVEACCPMKSGRWASACLSDFQRLCCAKFRQDSFGQKLAIKSARISKRLDVHSAHLPDRLGCVTSTAVRCRSTVPYPMTFAACHGVPVHVGRYFQGDLPRHR